MRDSNGLGYFARLGIEQTNPIPVRHSQYSPGTGKAQVQIARSHISDLQNALQSTRSPVTQKNAAVRVVARNGLTVRREQAPGGAERSPPESAQLHRRPPVQGPAPKPHVLGDLSRAAGPCLGENAIPHDLPGAWVAEIQERLEPAIRQGPDLPAAGLAAAGRDEEAIRRGPTREGRHG